eukprot:5443976-Pleurochrysis_carterae.AAC.1
MAGVPPAVSLPKDAAREKPRTIKAYKTELVKMDVALPPSTAKLADYERLWEMANARAASGAGSHTPGKRTVPVPAEESNPRRRRSTIHIGSTSDPSQPSPPSPPPPPPPPSESGSTDQFPNRPEDAVQTAPARRSSGFNVPLSQQAAQRRKSQMGDNVPLRQQFAESRSSNLQTNTPLSQQATERRASGAGTNVPLSQQGAARRAPGVGTN